jgi:hypothetical protein
MSHNGDYIGQHTLANSGGSMLALRRHMHNIGYMVRKEIATYVVFWKDGNSHTPVPGKAPALLSTTIPLSRAM